MGKRLPGLLAKSQAARRRLPIAETDGVEISFFAFLPVVSLVNWPSFRKGVEPGTYAGRLCRKRKNLAGEQISHHAWSRSVHCGWR